MAPEHFSDIPPAADRDALLTWLLRIDPSSAPGLAPSAFDDVFARLHWCTVVATEARWRDAPAALEELGAAFASALNALGSVSALTVTN